MIPPEKQAALRCEPAWPQITVLAAGCAGTALGLITLAGWLCDVPPLTSLGLESVPMAPSTALLFICHGVLLCLRVRPAPGRPARLYSAIAGGLAAAAALALLVLSVQGIRLPVEHLGMRITGDVRGIPVGHMSPVTAACFLLASLSALLSLPCFEARYALRLAAFGAAGVLLGTSCIFLLAYLYGKPLLYGGGFIPPAVNTALSFAVLGLGLLVAAGRRNSLSAELHRRASASGRFLLVFILFAAGMVTAGHVYYRGHEENFRNEVERQLSAVADLKVSEITQWRRERLGDGAVFFNNENFSNRVQRCIEAPGDTEARARLGTWLQKFREKSQYDRVFVLDAGGAEIAAEPAAAEPVAAAVRLAVTESLREDRPLFLDFYRNAGGGEIRLSVLVPISAADGRSPPLGVLVLRINPAQNLYPIILRWPTSSRTAETLLVRRDGDDVLFLNELRFNKDAALSLRLPLASPRLPAARAASGYEGIFAGTDYRGVNVIAAVRSVPDSPWFLVVRLDAAEAYAPLSERLWMMVALVMVLLCGFGGAAGLVWRQQSMRFYREQYESAEALRASEARYRALLENAPVAVFINRQDSVVEANLSCLKLFGADSRQQFLGKAPDELFHPASRTAMRERMQTLYEHGEPMPLLEHRIVRLDGAPVEVEVTAAPFEDHGATAIIVVLSDITERKRAEAALKANNDELIRFNYTVSHDLKAPLVTIRTFLGHLVQDMAQADEKRIAQDMGYIDSAAGKMNDLLEELLNFSRVGRIATPPSEVALQEIVGEALGLVAGRIENGGVRVQVTEQQVMLYGDRVRLVEVFQNLIDNAAKFMGDQSDPLVDIGAETIQGRQVLFVRDNGCGIDPRHHGKLFGLFEKFDARTEGTGIGLALVKRIVELHGGAIWAQSEGPGRGTCFRFTLPGKRQEPQ